MPTNRFKFRIWDQKNNLYWHNLPGATKHGIILTTEGSPGIVCDVTTPQEPEKTINYFETTYLTIEQWTGLVDKNGKEIYEGDVILSHNWDFPVKAVICYADHGAYFAACEIPQYLNGTRDGDLLNQPGDPWMIHVCEVIGNVHETPELLK